MNLLQLMHIETVLNSLQIVGNDPNHITRNGIPHFIDNRIVTGPLGEDTLATQKKAEVWLNAIRGAGGEIVGPDDDVDMV